MASPVCIQSLNFAIPLSVRRKPSTAARLSAGIAEGFIEPDSEEQVLEAWQYLHDTGLAYQLQGWFGRTAQSLIAQGLISE